jgi:hypothetical protein
MYQLQAQKRPVTELLRSSCNPSRWPHHQAFIVLFDVSNRRNHAHERRVSFTPRFRRFFAIRTAK